MQSLMHKITTKIFYLYIMNISILKHNDALDTYTRPRVALSSVNKQWDPIIRDIYVLVGRLWLSCLLLINRKTPLLSLTLRVY